MGICNSKAQLVESFNESNGKEDEVEPSEKYEVESSKEYLQTFEDPAALRVAISYYNLGIEYSLACGTDENFQKAAKSFKIAADFGIREAQFSYANALVNGLGVNKNLPQAKEYYKKAASNGHKEAKNHLGMIKWVKSPSSSPEQATLSSKNICSEI